MLYDLKYMNTKQKLQFNILMLVRKIKKWENGRKPTVYDEESRRL